MNLCLEFSVLLAARGRWGQIWFGDGAKGTGCKRQTGNVSGDLELETLRKRFGSSVQKAVN